MPGFLEEFITPIVKVSRGISASGVVSARGSQELCFFTIPEYDAWTRRASATKGWTIKYYKGLGTSTAVEAKNYFSNLDRHRLAFAYRDAHDDDALELAFAKNKADARKAWLAALEPDTYLAHAPGVVIPYADFVHRELILFSDASNLRAIPSVVDGFKPGQRKVLFSAFKRNLQKEIKVAQLAGYVGEHSCYHHGEASLCGTIVGMAQNFCGSNNANLFLPNGQFGTRLQGGKDAASPRYIYTALSELARLAFPAADDAQLTYLTDDGQSIEPRYYVPVLPMVLVNGSAGIGTGWSSTVPNFDARVIVANLRAMIDADGDPAGALALPDLVPHYRGFIGCIVPLTTHSYATVGVVEMIGGGGGGASAALHITELPIGTWTSAYKEAVLEPMLLAGEIVEFREHHTDTRVSFVVDLTPEQMRAHTSAGLHKRFKLTSSLSTSNMVLFNAAGGLERYATANHVVRAFYPVRWRYYVERKRAQLAVARADERRLTNKVRFIREVNAGVIVVKHGKTELLAALTRGKYDSMPSPKKTPPLLPPQQTSDAMEEAEEEQEDDDTDMVDAAATGSAAAAAAVVAAPAKHFDYLLGMPIWSLTRERADALAAECARKQAEVRALESTTPADMWRADLDAFEAGLDALEARQAEQEKQAHARSIEKRVAQVKSVEARAKLRAELTRPVPVGAVVPYAAEPKLVARSASATAPARGGGGTGTGTGTTLAAVVPMSMDDEEEEHDISTIE
jgi:DNA topoisomerase-2